MVSVIGGDSTTPRKIKTCYEHDDPIADAALEWFVRLQGAETLNEEWQLFERWLDEDVRHRQEFDKLNEIWGSRSFERAISQLTPSSSKHLVSARRSARWTIRTMAVAACVIVSVGLWQGPAMMVAYQADYATATGNQSLVSLPDGSSMFLNTDTAVSIDFDDGRRRVQLLKGEAYFDVKHDQAHPFQVAGDYGKVEVRGTAFSVRTDSSQTTVVLERGLVDVTCLCASRGEAQLLAGQTVTASATALSEISSSDPSRVLAWRNGRIAFDDVRLGSVIDELGRYYHGRVFIASNRVEQLVVSGNYRLDNIEGAIRTLADAAGVGMTRLPGGIIILR
ncbi:UNVERIFIED_ORG: transmembrane sensor [Agrobacterium larrymoorei]|uniref:FecR family protein n=1 Tax=Agrobacterium cavarae TaxID=2528239 RepID=A0ABY1YEY6_9HYPH|nr:FecR family protein [Agrobacterium cavarae]MDP9574013.1 transmembrane sensor [Agrobacterium larrymoorei]TBN18476.1 FecR family protein [Agrobacterium cavarae]